MSTTARACGVLGIPPMFGLHLANHIVSSSKLVASVPATLSRQDMSAHTSPASVRNNASTANPSVPCSFCSQPLTSPPMSRDVPHNLGREKQIGRRLQTSHSHNSSTDIPSWPFCEDSASNVAYLSPASPGASVSTASKCQSSPIATSKHCAPSSRRAPDSANPSALARSLPWSECVRPPKRGRR